MPVTLDLGALLVSAVGGVLVILVGIVLTDGRKRWQSVDQKLDRADAKTEKLLERLGDVEARVGILEDRQERTPSRTAANGRTA